MTTTQTSPLAASPPPASGGTVPAEVASPAPASAGTTPDTATFDPWGWLRDATAACGCCKALLENEQDIREVMAKHPENFADHRDEPPAQHPDDLVDGELELRVPADERLYGMRFESWL